jgi:predicted nucleic acid-binding Zn finger protein
MPVNFGKFFKIQMHAGEFQRIFQRKVSTLTPVFMPVNFGKIFKIQMHAGEFQRIFQRKVSTLTPVC